jgi:hypothetical protein
MTLGLLGGLNYGRGNSILKANQIHLFAISYPMTKGSVKSRVLTILLIGFAFMAYSQGKSQKANKMSEPFFPPHAFDAKSDLNSFVVDWYSKHLTALQEPSLWGISKSSKQEIYRFLWLRTFHPPIAIRLNVNSDGTGALTTKASNGAGGYEPGKLTKDESKSLSKAETQCFLDMVEKQKYWSLSTREEDPNVVGMDGAQWVLEGVRNGTYKIVYRWSPEDGPVRKIGFKMLFDFAKIKLPSQEVY